MTCRTPVLPARQYNGADNDLNEINYNEGAENRMKVFSNHFRELVERLLPEDPRILTLCGGPDMMILATWRLSTDPSRPNKRSRMLRIAISAEALEDYARGSDGVRLASDNRFVAWLHGSNVVLDSEVPCIC